MRVLIGATLVVGSMANGHCANADCASCETDFAACGGYATSASWATAMEALGTNTSKTDAETNCFNMGMDVAVVAAPFDNDACTATGGTFTAGADAWTPVFSAGTATCNDLAATWADGDGADACTGSDAVAAIAATWTDSLGECTVAGTGGGAGTNAADCDTDDAVNVTTFAASAAATCLGAGAVAENIANQAACETANADATAAAVTAAEASCVNGAGADIGDVVNAGWTDSATCQVAVAMVASSCAGATNANAGTWSTDCTAAKAIACVAHYDVAANADCLTPAADPSSADPSDASPASMLQVGAAVLASLAMLL